MFTKEQIQTVKDFGYDVYITNDTPEWLIFTDGINIGYLGKDTRGALAYSTVHKPSKKVGTGYRLENNSVQDDCIISEAKLKECFTMKPHWDIRTPINLIRKYKNIQEFLDNKYSKYYQA